MLRIAICDDDKWFVARLSELVNNEFKKHTSDKLEIEKYVSSELMLTHHKSKPFEVIFLDIDMPNMNGFDVAANISYNDSYIIFVTNHPELVYDSFNFRPLNFIPKSNDSYFTDKLQSVVNQLFNEMKQNKSIIVENKDIGRVALIIKEIYYIESSKHYVIYHSENYPPITVRGNISDLEKEYAHYDFVRIHKSFLVNLKHVFNIDKNRDEIIFKHGKRLNMSKNYKPIIDEKLTQYLRKTK